VVDHEGLLGPLGDVALARGASRVVAAGRNETALKRLAGVDPRVAPVALSGDRDRDSAAIIASGGEPAVVIDALGARWS
jgi:alcohol dehydrogenase